jgi:hypothetical protein
LVATRLVGTPGAHPGGTPHGPSRRRSLWAESSGILTLGGRRSLKIISAYPERLHGTDLSPAAIELPS